MKSIGAGILRTDLFPGVDHMRGMQNQIIINIAFMSETQLIQLYKFVFTIPTQNSNINLRSKPPFSHILCHIWVNAVMQF